MIFPKIGCTRFRSIAEDLRYVFLLYSHRIDNAVNYVRGTRRAQQEARGAVPSTVACSDTTDRDKFAVYLINAGTGAKNGDAQ